MAIFIYENLIVGGVLRQIILNKIANYYGLKTKITIEAYLKIKWDKAYTDEDTFIEYEKRKKFLVFHSELYVYNNNSKLNLKAKKIFDSNRDLLAK